MFCFKTYLVVSPWIFNSCGIPQGGKSRLVAHLKFTQIGEHIERQGNPAPQSGDEIIADINRRIPCVGMEIQFIDAQLGGFACPLGPIQNHVNGSQLACRDVLEGSGKERIVDFLIAVIVVQYAKVGCKGNRVEGWGVGFMQA